MLGAVLHSAKPRLSVPWLSRHNPSCFRRLYTSSCSGILTNTSNNDKTRSEQGPERVKWHFTPNTKSPGFVWQPIRAQTQSSEHDSLEFRVHILKIPAERVTVQLPSQCKPICNTVWRDRSGLKE